jgi:NitT/TauT family transport system permease protein
MTDAGEPLGLRMQVALGVLGVVGSAFLAEVLVRTGVIATPGFPLPSDVLGALGTLVGDSGFWGEVGFTLREWGLAMAIATVAGVLLGGLMGAFRTCFVAVEWPVEVFRVLPSVAVGPVLLLMIGTGMLPLAITVALACVWPILLNTMYGVRATDPTAVHTARTFGMSRMAIFARIKLRSAMPFAYTGVRIAASIGLIVAVSAELLIGNGRGIGGFILVRSTQSADLDIVYAATLTAGLIGVLVNLAFGVLDARVFGWKKGLAQ